MLSAHLLLKENFKVCTSKALLVVNGDIYQGKSSNRDMPRHFAMGGGGVLEAFDLLWLEK